MASRTVCVSWMSGWSPSSVQLPAKRGRLYQINPQITAVRQTTDCFVAVFIQRYYSLKESQGFFFFSLSLFQVSRKWVLKDVVDSTFLLDFLRFLLTLVKFLKMSSVWLLLLRIIALGWVRHFSLSLLISLCCWLLSTCWVVLCSCLDLSISLL